MRIGAPGEIISCIHALNPAGRAKARSKRQSCLFSMKSLPCNFPLRAALKRVQKGNPAFLVELEAGVLILRACS